MEDYKIDSGKWADMIDECRKRNATGDLSCISYRMLHVIIKLKNEAEEVNNG